MVSGLGIPQAGKQLLSQVFRESGCTISSSIGAHVNAMNKSIRALIFHVGLIWSPILHAGNYTCTGNVSQVTVEPGGNVNISLSFKNGESMSWVYLCSLTDMSKSVTPATCKGILSTVMVAKLSDRSITMWFNNAVETCNAPPWSHLKDFNWHFGPSIQ